ncbi:MBL fold metallo-hydrolase RNA specificity domain-containing protein [Thiogranum longum]
MATLTFFGATQQVTGSCYLIQTASGRILLECGMVQGENTRDKEKQKMFPFYPSTVDAVILSHAHLDHSGLLPQLVADGFSGPIYVTDPTYDLLDLMLKDSANLYFQDLEWTNRHRLRSGKEPLEPQYTMDDVEHVLELRHSIDYGVLQEVIPGIELRYHDAGHIIGSAIVELDIRDGGKTRKLVFSGDLGNSYSPLMRDPDVLEKADILLLESTYGDRDHRPLKETLEEFRQALQTATEKGGNVLIPAFAVGRTQDLIYHLGQLYHDGALSQQSVFIDSPMAISASRIYERHTHLFNQDNPAFRKVIDEGWDKWLPILRYTASPSESMALNQITGGAVIIAGSGMCTGGRICHHFKHNLWRSNAQVIIAGFQARGTLGRKLVDGATMVNVLGNEIAVKATIHTIGGFSAHAGQSQLLAWAEKFAHPRPRLFLIHGEIDKMLALQKRFVSDHDWDAYIPSLGELVHL